ncbi:MAG: chromosome segregation protein SMC [Rhodothermales bacterium]|nr:chromosome segregation protein SMC [Rhodothermales bacterium]MBO6778443.1 chromosome segregation protein SMC [Rhodothermales bacterium]
MYLSKLELHGFKSFADRTVVNFAPGITVVVGPNGCGKSNVVDAVRWAIGEQRARILRSEKMENVIFNGAGNRKALGVAEVMLTIENNRGVLPTEYNEVTIGRRLYRSGESEYLLNGTQCRLKDITDLFMDTGMGAGAYSVIELKMIEELLSDNAVDRRRLFEEAAGITKYKIRRAQTLRKLGATQVDLTRVRDLTEELQKRVRSLERQAKKASRFKTHKERLSALELALAQTQYDHLTGETARIGDSTARLGDVLEADGARLAEREAEHENLRTRHIEREQALVATQTRLSAHVEKLRAAQSDERLIRERLAVIERDIQRLTEDQKNAEHRATHLTESLEVLQVTIAGAQPATEEAEKALDVARAERDQAVAAVESQRKRVQAARTEERQASDALSDLRRNLDRSSSRVEMMQEELAGLDERESALKDQVDTAARNAEAAEAAKAEAEAAVEAARAAVDDSVATKELRQAKLSEARQTLADAQRRMDAARAETGLLESLLASFDDFSESVQFLAGNDDWSEHALATVADLIGCDPSHGPAVEAALGDFASCLVVHTQEEAHRAIAKLRDSEKGRATFIVLDRLPEVSVSAPPSSEARPLTDLVRVESAYGRLARVLLGDCYLVEDLDAALRLSGPGARCFSPSGEWVRDGGVVCGGSATSGETGSARFGRREQLERARTDLSAAEQDVARLQQEATSAQQALAAVDLPAAERALRDALSRASQTRSAGDRAAMERDNVTRRIDELLRRRNELSEAVDAYRQDIASRSEAVSGALERVGHIETVRTREEEAFQSLEAAGRTAIGSYSEAKVTAVQARNHLENLDRDLSRVEEEIVRLEQGRENRTAQIANLEQQKTEAVDRIEYLEEAIDLLEQDKVSIEREVLTAKDALSEIKVAISELDVALRDLRRTREQHIQEQNALNVKAADLEARTENLLAATREDFEIDLTETRIEPPEDFEASAAREEVRELRQRIRNLGPVNELALETFEEEKERLTFMETQLADLEKAEGTLMETISEINTTASERFEKTFAAIQANFSQLFEHLFGENASARVVLQNPDDPLESDIEIFAKPRGKKPSVLAQLSGGEKTLTAIALLFSIYLVKPSPFCILDEVDAPLDDANVDRFMDLIRSFADSTQFVLVTHNKRTMEAADRMYGITMQTQGVSRLVGVEFDKDPEMVLVA